jgi:hypothetical protein
MKRLVHEVPGALSFQADGRDGLRLRMVASGDAGPLESVAALLRIVGAADPVPVPDPAGKA